MTIQQDPTHPTGVTSDDAGGSHLKRARNRKAAAALDLKTRHYKLEDIAVVLGYPNVRAVGVAIERMLEDHLAETDKVVLRQIAYRRIENAQRAIYDKVMDPKHPEQISAFHAYLKGLDRQSKLMGTDMPSEVIVTNPIAQELQAWIDNAIELKRIHEDGSPLALTEGDPLGSVIEGEFTEDDEEEDFEPMTDEEWAAARGK